MARLPPRVGDHVLVRLPGAWDDHLYPAIVIRSWGSATINAAVFVDSEAKSAQATGPIVTVENAEPFDFKNPLLGGWCWREDSGGG